MGVQKCLGEPPPLGAEDQGITGLEPCAGVGLGRLGTEKPEPIGTESFNNLVETIDDLISQVFPIIEASPSTVPVAKSESERPDQPKAGPDRHAGSADRAGVGCNLRLDQHNMESGIPDQTRHSLSEGCSQKDGG